MRIKEDGGGAGRSRSYICDAHLGSPKKTAPKKKETTVSAPALDRATKKKEAKATKRESIQGARVRCQLIETVDADPGTATKPEPRAEVAGKKSKFSVILIQEGLGNTKDGYYYTKDALKSAVAAFEGKKLYANHPSKFEDQVRPERDVKDVYGHYQNLKYQEAEDGTGQLAGELVVLPGPDADWVRDRMFHAVNYAKQYPNQDFLGLSINASGDAMPVDAKEFLESGQVVDSAKAKLQEAIAEGLAEVKLVNLIDSAVSCDLVTEAGARGKVLQLLEADKMKHEAKKEAEEKKKEADGAHDDEEQDKALIKDQLKKHGLIKGDEKDADGEKEEAVEEAKADDEDAEKKEEPKEADHAESEEAMMQAAMHYHKAYKQSGYESKEAAERAVEAMKCAKHAHDAMESEKKESEAHKEADEGKKEEKKEAAAKEKHKESAAVAKEGDALIKLQGENAALKDKLAKIETEQYLDKKLKESKLPMSVTKKFKESVKTFKNAKDVDEKLNLFMEGYKADGGEADSLDAFVMTEKQTATAGEGAITLDDCVAE